MKKMWLLLLVILLSGCSFMGKNDPKDNPQGAAPPGSEEKRIVIYSTGSPEIVEKVAGKFKVIYPEYQVDIRHMSGGAALDELETAKKNPQGDIWLGATPGELIAGKRQGLFRPIPTDIGNLLNSSYRDADYQWMAAVLFPQAFVTAQITGVDQLPWQWEELTMPKFQNQLLMISPEFSQNYRIWLGAVMYRKGYFRQEYAKKWLLGVDANTQRYFTNEREMMERISAYPGTVAWLALGDAVRWQQKEKFPIKIYLPQGSQPVFFTGAALVKDAPHRSGGELFLKFFYSNEIQGMLMKEDFVISPRETMPSDFKPSWYNQWSLSPQDLDWEWIEALEDQHLTFWEEEIHGRGTIPPDKKKLVEMSTPKK